MEVTRRELLLGAGALSLSAGDQTNLSLPDKASFAIEGLTYLDSGSQHPMLIGGVAAINAYLERRKYSAQGQSYSLPELAARQKFARLINAEVGEIAFTPSTTAAEQAIVRGLGIPGSRQHVITDTLHFFGSIPHYLDLEKRGVKVTWVRAQDGRIPLQDIKRALKKKTKLVALSLVSTINGFEHDLEAVCEAAHRAGALVFADIIHAAGSLPIDVKKSGVDFAACASYKWLMGEFGLGFIYVRKDSLRHLTNRSEFSYYGVEKFDTHIYPLDPPGSTIADYRFFDDAVGFMAYGTHAQIVTALLDHSLDYIHKLGVDRIQAHAQSLVAHLKEELPKLGYPLMTPPESRAPIVACLMADARNRLKDRLAAGKLRITTAANRFRVTPSVFNDHADIERLLSVLGKA